MSQSPVVSQETDNGCAAAAPDTIDVTLRALRRSRHLADQIVSQRTPPKEWALLVVSVCSGVLLRVLFDLRAGPTPGVLAFASALGVTIIAAGVVAHVLGKYDTQHPRSLAQLILQELPDPNQAPAVPRPLAALAGTWKLISTTQTSGKQASGRVTITPCRSSLVMSGTLDGSNGRFGHMRSSFCDFEPETKRLTVVYSLTGLTDEGMPVNSQCVMLGFLAEPTEVKAVWHHLSGPAVAGNATLTRESQ